MGKAGEEENSESVATITSACLTAKVCFKGGLGRRFVEGEGGMDESTHTQDLQQCTLVGSMKALTCSCVCILHTVSVPRAILILFL